MIVGGKGTKGKCGKASAVWRQCGTYMSMKVSKASAQTVIQTQLQTVSQQTNQALWLIGATALGRSLHRGFPPDSIRTDCRLHNSDIRSNTDMIQIRPAFGGNIMAQIGITKSRPQFATVRYKVMDKAEKNKKPAWSGGRMSGK